MTEQQKRKRKPPVPEPWCCFSCKSMIRKVVPVLVNCPTGQREITKRSIRQGSVQIEATLWEQATFYCPICGSIPPGKDKDNVVVLGKPSLLAFVRPHDKYRSGEHYCGMSNDRDILAEIIEAIVEERIAGGETNPIGEIAVLEGNRVTVLEEYSTDDDAKYAWKQLVQLILLLKEAPSC